MEIFFKNLVKRVNKKAKAIENKEIIDEAEAIPEEESTFESKAIENKEVIDKAEAIPEEESTFESKAIENKEIIDEAEATPEEESTFKSKAIKKTKAIEDKEIIDKAEAIPEEESTFKSKAIENKEVIGKTEAIPEEESTFESKAIEKTKAIEDKEIIDKAEAIPEEESTFKSKDIEKTEAIENKEVIRKTEVVPREQPLLKPKAIDNPAEAVEQVVGSKSKVKDKIPPPFLSYITFNRLGLTARSLKSILDTTEDFEMHIIDSNSRDDTWEYLQSIKDSRIKSMTRLTLNEGPVFALNRNLSKRRKDQYFFTVDSDVVIKTKDWITRFMEVFNEFPEVGLLGVQRTPPYIPIYPKVITKSRNGVTYLELKNGYVDVLLDFVHGCCMGMRPELIEKIGYWSEETCYGDGELSTRITNYTDFKAGFMSDQDKMPLIDIDMTQEITCEECIAREYCKLNKDDNTCFNIHMGRYKNAPFAKQFKWKYLEFFKDLEEGKRTAYCASIYDPYSIATHEYNKEWAQANREYYINNSNDNDE
ncbi:glycosyltransferase [Clostridium botulinum]|nr:glycosyl transferase [Clostridium botulinum]MBN3364538.1 glycosyl transferase [Clostridium botulinum]MBN3376034.1 glycosyl transferase [Clostridium botulinum]MBN3385294.1 glycosyl transferase [Clostridium botulinum]MBN3394106.1 glycosyl transferase [Clostridium botulinum]